MNNIPVTQRVLDAADLILVTAATKTEQTGHNITSALTHAEKTAAETYQLNQTELSQAARLATHAAFTTGTYSIEAITNRTTRATALRNAIPRLKDQPKDQSCSTGSEPRSAEPNPSRPTPPKTYNASAKHSRRNAPVWTRFVRFLSRTSNARSSKQPACKPTATTPA